MKFRYNFVMNSTRNRLQKIIKDALSEPLLHFLVIGGLLYGYFDMTQKNPALAKKKEITLLSYDLKQLEKRSDIGDAALLLDYLKYEKALLEDAYALDLNKDDASIQKTLLKKRESILNARAKPKEPTQKELQTYYKKHPKDFSKLLRFDLLVKKFDRDAEIGVIKKVLLFGDMKKAKNIESYKNVDLATVRKKFGKYIALKIASTPEGYWSEPLLLQDGIYLFYVGNKKTGELQPFEDVESDVYRQYLYTKRVQTLKKAYREMLKNYVFKVKQ